MADEIRSESILIADADGPDFMPSIEDMAHEINELRDYFMGDKFSDEEIKKIESRINDNNTKPGKAH